MELRPNRRGLYRNEFRTETTRLRGWDYNSAGWYFVTICTAGRRPLLGAVTDGVMTLSSAGEVVAEEWARTEMVRDRVRLDEWIVMPNHMHAIIVLEAGDPETPRRGVSTGARLQAGSLGAIIGQFKSVSTKRIRGSILPDFAWQPRFYDHIIRSERALGEIREYIVNNPAKWSEDRDNPANLYM